jgi:hypothetical protein
MDVDGGGDVDFREFLFAFLRWTGVNDCRDGYDGYDGEDGGGGGSGGCGGSGSSSGGGAAAAGAAAAAGEGEVEVIFNARNARYQPRLLVFTLLVFVFRVSCFVAFRAYTSHALLNTVRLALQQHPFHTHNTTQHNTAHISQHNSTQQTRATTQL